MKTLSHIGCYDPGAPWFTRGPFVRPSGKFGCGIVLANGQYRLLNDLDFDTREAAMQYFRENDKRNA